MGILCFPHQENPFLPFYGNPNQNLITNLDQFSTKQLLNAILKSLAVLGAHQRYTCLAEQASLSNYWLKLCNQTFSFPQLF